MSYSQIMAMIFGLIVAIFYIPLLLMLAKQFDATRARKEFFNAVLSIIERESNNEKASEQATIVFKKLAERKTHIQKKYMNALDLCEDLLCRHETYGRKRFKSLYSIEFDQEKIQRLVKIIETIKEKQPFGSISNKYGNQLNMIKHAFDTDNKTLGTSNLLHLANDIELLESTLSRQEKRNQFSLMVSTVGVVLTIVFGVLSLISFIGTAGI